VGKNVDAAKADPDLLALRRVASEWDAFNDADTEDIHTCVARGWLKPKRYDDYTQQYTFTVTGRIALAMRFQKEAPDV